MAATSPTPTAGTLPGAVGAIEVEGIVKEFEGTFALRGVTLALRRGERVALLGPNGAGKTTLLGVLSALVRPTGGRIAWRDGAGQELDADRARGRIGLLSHETFLYGDLSARENLRFWGRLYGRDAATAARAADEWITNVALDRRAADRPVRTLSRGMRQRAGIARALLTAPDFLLLDEPFTGLDQEGAVLLDRLLRAAAAGGLALLLCSHDLERAAPLADRVVVLRAGRVALDRAVDSARAVEDLRQAWTTAVSDGGAEPR